MTMLGKCLAVTVRCLHDASGLTWEQLGRLFGVSRRAVHHWANGGKMTAFHAEALARLTQVVDGLPASDIPSRRAHLLAPGANGRSLYERLRSDMIERTDVINGAPLTPAQLLGAADDYYLEK